MKRYRPMMTIEFPAPPEIDLLPAELPAVLDDAAAHRRELRRLTWIAAALVCVVALQLALLLYLESRPPLRLYGEQATHAEDPSK